MEKSSSEEDGPVDETDVSPSTTAASTDKPEVSPPSKKALPVPLSKELQAASNPAKNGDAIEKSTKTDPPEEGTERKRKLEGLQLEVSSRKLPKVVTDIRSIMSAMAAGDIVPVS